MLGKRLAFGVPMGLTVPAQTLQYSPRSLKPSTPISAPQLLSGTVGLVLAVMPCSTKPHGKPSALQVLRECLSPGKDDRDQGPFPKTDWDIFSSFISFQFTCSGKNHERQRLHVWLWAPASTSHKCVLFSCFLGFLTFSSLFHNGSATYLRIKDEPFPKIYCREICMSWFSNHFLQIVCRRDACCSGPSLSPGSAQCTEHRYVQKQLGLSSKTTFANMTVICHVKTAPNSTCLA